MSKKEHSCSLEMYKLAQLYLFGPHETKKIGDFIVISTSNKQEVALVKQLEHKWPNRIKLGVK